MEDTLKRHMILTDDSKANFMCGFEPKPIGNGDLISGGEKEIIGLDKVDYMLNTETDEPEPEFNNADIIAKQNTQEDKQKTLSYLSVKSVEEGIEWYKKEFPKLPDELIPMMSRWNFGDLKDETKKSVRNNRKKNKKKELKQSGLKIVNKPILISFD